MNKEQALIRLRSLKVDFLKYGPRKDVAALEYAINELERTAQEVPVQEQLSLQEAREFLIKQFKSIASRDELCDSEIRNMLDIYSILFPYRP